MKKTFKRKLRNRVKDTKELVYDRLENYWQYFQTQRF